MLVNFLLFAHLIESYSKMPQASPNYNLYVLKPNLVKEWHPTKNAGIKPQEVTPGSGKKVWWICEQGHEWEAAVYSRNTGSVCPYCSNSKSPNDRGFSVSDSEFKMEWHPSANGSLTPIKVTMNHPDKIWWLCRDGHEWQAFFQDRLRGQDCPACTRRRDKQIQPQNMTVVFAGASATGTDWILETEPLDISYDADFPKKRHYAARAKVTVEVQASKHTIFAQLKNFSQGGMCLEIPTALTPGTKVNIKLDRPLLGSSQESYDSVIKWCKGLADEHGSVNNFGMGVQFI